MDEAAETPEAWQRQFVTLLLEMRPSLRSDEAAEVATLAFEAAGDLAPRDAAEVFADVLKAEVPIPDLKRWAFRAGKRPRP
jgi:hypothetical protein